MKVNLVAKIVQSAYLSQAQKITISRGFNLHSNSRVKSKVATIVGDITVSQQRHYP